MVHPRICIMCQTIEVPKSSNDFVKVSTIITIFKWRNRRTQGKHPAVDDTSKERKTITQMKAHKRKEFQEMPNKVR